MGFPLWRHLGLDDEAASPAAVYAAWGSIALAGIAPVALASATFGDRPPTKIAAPAPPPQPQIVIRTDPALAAETQRLVDTVRTLSADRDRLLQRVEQMERTLGDVTAAIPRDRAAGLGPASVTPAPVGQTAPTPLSALPPPDVTKPAPAPALAPPAEPVKQTAVTPTEPSKPQAAETPKPAETAKPAESAKAEMAKSTEPGRTTAAAPPALIPIPVPAPRARGEPPPVDSVGTRTEFGIDLGSDTSIDGLRSLWAAIRGKNSQLLDGLKPLVSVRDGPRQGTVELRLIAGPLANASAAARMCAALGTTGIACQPTQFDGQRLALR